MTFLIFALLMVFPFEEQGPECDFTPQIKYSASGLTFFQMSRLEGVAVLSLNDTKEENGKVEDVCLGLYNELTLKLIAIAKTDKDGRFTFGQIKPGLYRLISKASAFHSVNVPIQVSDSQLTEAEQKMRLILHMRFLKDERKSSATLEEANESLSEQKR